MTVAHLCKLYKIWVISLLPDNSFQQHTTQHEIWIYGWGKTSLLFFLIFTTIKSGSQMDYPRGSFCKYVLAIVNLTNFPCLNKEKLALNAGSMQYIKIHSGWLICDSVWEKNHSVFVYYQVLSSLWIREPCWCRH